MRANVTLQQLLKRVDWATFMPIGAHKHLRAMRDCRTPAMGHHHYTCSHEDCQHEHKQYNSCRNRHCNLCGSQDRDEWLEHRMAELVPISYFHVVFTLPSVLHRIVLWNQKVLYDLLFDATQHTLQTLAKDEQYLGAQVGITAVLHTWGQQLNYHPHVHCIVSGGGVGKDGNWKTLKRRDSNFLFPARAMEKMYRGYFMEQLKALVASQAISLPVETEWKVLKEELYASKWVIYAKPPFSSPATVVEYLGRYTHKVAISNHRLLGIDEQNNIRFQYKDYRCNGKQRVMTLDGKEFIRRLGHHFLPKGFVKIRHYGYLGNFNRTARLEALAKQFGTTMAPKVVVPYTVRLLEKYGLDVQVCPKCKQGSLLLVGVVQGKGGRPPTLVPPKPLAPNTTFYAI